MMYAVNALSSAQQQQQAQQSEPSSSSSEWGAPPGSANSPASTGSAGPWGSSATSSMTDITNKPSANNNGVAQPAADWSSLGGPSPTSSGSTSVWQSNEPGDNKNSWNSPAATAQAKNALLSNNSSGSAQQQGQDKENLPTTPVAADRTPLDHMIYRQGWGQVEVKQEVPWSVPESPPPVHEDPSMWKPKANTGTEVWEKSTGHRTQPWQTQTPNTPRWMSGEEREEGSSVWNGTPGSNPLSGPNAAGSLSNSGGGGGSGGVGGGMMMNGGSGGNGGSGNSILSSGPVSQPNRPNWNSSGPGSGGSGASSGGNISPTGNQWNDNVQDQEWSEWRDPSSITKRENVNGTDLWGSNNNTNTNTNTNNQAPMRSSNSLYGGSNTNTNMASLNSDPRKPQSDERPRGWQDSSNYASSSSQMQPQRSSADWNADNEWRGSDNEKSSRSQWATGGRDHQQQRPSSPPNNVGRYSREQIYQSKQYQGLLEMGFKRDDIDTAMRNNNMNYEATLSDLKRRRLQQQQMQMQASLAGNSSFGGMGGVDATYKTGLPATAVGMMNGPGGAQQAHQNSQMQQQAGKTNRPVPNIHALANQLSLAARQGIINPRLLNQQLAPQTTFLLHKLMGQHRQLQQLNAQHEMLSMASQKPSNPSLQQQQQQQLSQIVVHIQQTKKEIMNLQKQIDVMQNEYAKSPMDPRFQGGDLASASMSPPSFQDFHSPQQAAQAPTGVYNPGWRMPDPTSQYNSPLMGPGDSWGSSNFMAAANTFTSPPVMTTPMWNDPNQWGMHGAAAAAAAQGGMNHWRGMAPASGGANTNMDEWTSHMGMKSPSGPGMSGGVGDALSPGSRGGVSGNGSAAFGMDDTDGSHWGGNRQGDSSTFSSANSTFSASRFAWDTLPEFEPGKPWRGSQLLSADDDPHLTPGSVQNKNPLMNAVTSGGGGHYNSNDQ